MAKWNLFGGTPATAAASPHAVAVIGLGRFGRALALELMAGGAEVLGIDAREEVVQSLDGALTHVVRADATQEEVLRQLSVHEFERVVVGIGTDIQSSILVTSLLLRFGTAGIWAKSVSEAHGTILRQLGVEHVVHPETEMGKRVAHLVRGSMQDYIEVDNGFALIKTTPPGRLLGRPLRDTGLRQEYGVTITAVRTTAGDWRYTTAETVLERGDVILVAGPIRKVERFSQTC